jgi:exodeoxyribonuclease-3
MKIITWNCNMAFRKKAAAILAYKPDILIVPECEHPDKLIFPEGITQPDDVLWFGKNLHKGLAIFSYSGFRLKVQERHNRKLQLILPISVTGPGLDFNLLAVWANNPLDKDGRYVEQVWKAIHYYDDLLSRSPAVIVGDLNSNTIWDRKSRAGNHSDVVDFLEGKGIRSAYHVHHKQQQGAEKHPTHYLYRHQDRPYHLDYCFISDDLVRRLKSVEVGEFGYWSQFSDHVPVMVTLRKVRGKR